LTVHCVLLNDRRTEVKKLTDVLTRLFNEPHLKVLGVFIDALIHVIATHSPELTDWLPVMLPRLLTKSGSDTVVSLHSKMLRAFDIIRFDCICELITRRLK